MWLFGSLWERWRLAFKVVTPILHVAFSAAQIHGSFVFWRMYRRQQGFRNEVNAEAGDRNATGEDEGLVKDCQSQPQCGTEEKDTDPGLSLVESNAPIAPVDSGVATR